MALRQATGISVWVEYAAWVIYSVYTQTMIELAATEFAQLQLKQRRMPVCFRQSFDKSRDLWWWMDRFYVAVEGLTDADVIAGADEALSMATRTDRLRASITKKELWDYELKVRHGFFGSVKYEIIVKEIPPFAKVVLQSEITQEVYAECRTAQKTDEGYPVRIGRTGSKDVWIARGSLYTVDEDLMTPEELHDALNDAAEGDPQRTARLWPAEDINIESPEFEGVTVYWARNRDKQIDGYARIGSAEEYEKIEVLRKTTPVALARDKGRHRTLWWYRDGHWWDDEGLTAEEVELTLFDRERRREAKFDRLRTIRARDADLAGARRERIPDEVRAFVWERDEGRCVRCGAEDDLQFDHVIPVAKGGGNAAGNVQILCGDCNRQKRDAIV